MCHRDINGKKLSGKLYGHFETYENEIILAIVILKCIYYFYNHYYPYYNKSSPSVPASRYFIKGRGKNIPCIKNLPKNAKQYAFLMDSLLSWTLQVSFRKLWENFSLI